MGFLLASDASNLFYFISNVLGCGSGNVVKIPHFNAICIYLLSVVKILCITFLLATYCGIEFHKKMLFVSYLEYYNISDFERSYVLNHELFNKIKKFVV